MLRYTIFLLFAIISNIIAQLDTVKGDWPFSPFTSSLRISATFAEFRNTLTSDHFHNAADVPEPDGNPCYPSLDGTVYYKANDGSNSYIRIVTQVGSEWKHLTYLHVIPNPSITVGDSVKKGKTILGTIASGMGHVHLIERELVAAISSSGVEINNLRKNG
jgi:murein DD-endopeptidase MepM/ murein hydrolase activator NlpD